MRGTVEDVTSATRNYQKRRRRKRISSPKGKEHCAQRNSYFQRNLQFYGIDKTIPETICQALLERKVEPVQARKIKFNITSSIARIANWRKNYPVGTKQRVKESNFPRLDRD